LVGAGVASQRCDDPSEAVEAFDLMAAALGNAAEDAGSRQLLAQADWIHVPRGSRQYSDPGRLVADRIGAQNAKTVLADIGILQQTLINDACRAIASGKADVVLVTGGDCKYRALRASITGVEVKDTEQTDVSPDVLQQAHSALFSDLESSRGLTTPVAFYSLMENALRYHLGLSLDEQRDEIAELWARFSRTAAENPHAWRREPVSAEEIRNPSEKNKMLAFPYTKLHNSQWNVDQAAGLVFCSVERAGALGISKDRWVFPLSGTESNHMLNLSERAEMYRVPGAAIAGGRALELAGLVPERVAHADIYSCFPVSVRIKARELGFGFDRPLTVTGGMTFAGGPLNNYVMQATARMAEILREDPGSAGLVTTVSGFITKQGFGVWSTDPPRNGYRFEDLTDEVAKRTETRTAVDDYEGPATIAGYTVLHTNGEPSKGIAICDLPDGTRTVASTDDVDIARAMTAEEFCGQKAMIGRDGGLRG
jgi:acetyl-CoA C-acetyltransferase